jgi:cobalt/nickel transport system permease protein
MDRQTHAVDHAHLYVPGSSPVHTLAPEAKLVGLLVFVIAVASTPRRSVVAFAVDLLAIGAVIAIAGLRPTMVATRLAVIVPFVLFAALVPFVAGGDAVEVLGVSMSREGLWASFGVVAKAGLGALASIVFASTTPIPDVLRALHRLRVPSVVVAIVAFMFRYLDLLLDQLRRMRHAMVARCHDPRWLWQVAPIASSAGTLFVRSYERGERVHQAMLARGYGGTMPVLDEVPRRRSDLLVAVVPGVVAWLALAVAVGT